jgi:hypothetical protein
MISLAFQQFVHFSRGSLLYLLSVLIWADFFGGENLIRSGLPGSEFIVEDEQKQSCCQPVYAVEEEEANFPHEGEVAPLTLPGGLDGEVNGLNGCRKMIEGSGPRIAIVALFVKMVVGEIDLICHYGQD